MLQSIQVYCHSKCYSRCRLLSILCCCCNQHVASQQVCCVVTHSYVALMPVHCWLNDTIKLQVELNWLLDDAVDAVQPSAGAEWRPCTWRQLQSGLQLHKNHEANSTSMQSVALRADFVTLKELWMKRTRDRFSRHQLSVPGCLLHHVHTAYMFSDALQKKKLYLGHIHATVDVHTGASQLQVLFVVATCAVLEHR